MLYSITARAGLILALALALAACGGDSKPQDVPDAAMPNMPTCGNSVVDPGEECDDGNTSDDDACLNSCKFSCGDGVVQPHEACDTAIAAGQTGACPDPSCSDGDNCTTDSASGTGCQLTCVHGPITAPAAGDGCCPPGADINSDPDCPTGCGNGVVEAGESCDTAIAAGQPGACPTACDDGVACTADTLTNGGSCTAACTHTEITQPHAGDGCCPAGANHSTDSDCSLGCGDGIVSAGETCDTAIAAGQPGACPTSCDDHQACTTDSLVGGGTCTATCGHVTITTPANGDGCCPAAGNANNDHDCQPVCGNHVLEPGEDCDDGNANAGDGCDAHCKFEPTAFRVNHLEVKDPHIYYDGTCGDITAVANFLVNDSIAKDKSNPPDGSLDLNALTVFKPLAQAQMSTALDVDFGATCTAPVETTQCTATGMSITATTANNQASGMCLGTLPNTTFSGYSPAVTSPSGPCFVSNAESLDVNIGTVVIHLEDARIAGTYVGSPATSVSDGLIRGFISKDRARMITFPADLPLVGGKTLAQLLTGGDNTCNRPDGMTDLDTGPNGQQGWYMYINYTSGTVPYHHN